MRKWEVWCDYWDVWSGERPELVVKWSKIFNNFDEAEAFYRNKVRNKERLCSVHIKAV